MQDDPDVPDLEIASTSSIEHGSVASLSSPVRRCALLAEVHDAR
jgi:hypothetical protein